MEHLYTLRLAPVPAPRQTRSDKWNPRPCVLRYRAFKDHLRQEIQSLGVPLDKLLPESPWIVFRIGVPKSWSKKQKNEAIGTPHRAKPDCDNLEKALFDAIYSDDSHIWDVRATKIWDWEDSIEIWSQPPYHEVFRNV